MPRSHKGVPRHIATVRRLAVQADRTHAELMKWSEHASAEQRKRFELVAAAILDLLAKIGAAHVEQAGRGTVRGAGDLTRVVPWSDTGQGSRIPRERPRKGAG